MRPLCLHQITPRTEEDQEYQKTRRRGLAGAARQGPDLRRITTHDLRETGRLLTLYDQVVQAGRARRGHWPRLRFVGLAQRALRCGRCPPRLFVWLWQHGLYHWISLEDEDRAMKAIKSHERGLWAEQAPPPEPKPKRPRRSSDAVVADAMIALAARIGYTRDPINLVRQHRPGWTRGRWQRACNELDALHAAKSVL